MSIALDALIAAQLASIESGVAQLNANGAKEGTSNSILGAINANLTLTRTLLQNQLVMLQLLSAIQGTLVERTAQLQSVVGNPQQSGQPVTLPGTPPPGYGGGAPSDIAEAVWNYGEPPFDFVPFTAITGLWQLLVATRDVIAFPLNYSDKFLVQGNLFSQDFFPWPSPPEINPSDILPTDATRLDWLTRVAPEFDWTYRAVADVYYAPFPGGAEGTLWCVLSEQEFIWYRAAASGTLPGTETPPAWPGLDNVTLLAAQPLVDGLIVTELMDGVIVAIDTPPTAVQRTPYGTVQAFGHIGALAFGTDDGDYEAFQFLGFQNAVYCPRSMTIAQSVAFRVRAGLTGTVTPWTRT